MRRWIHAHFSTICLILGCVLINVALVYGAGLSLGWWGWLFWVGVGLLYAAIKDDINDVD